MNFNAVNACFLAKSSGFCKSLNNFVNLFFGKGAAINIICPARRKLARACAKIAEINHGLN